MVVQASQPKFASQPPELNLSGERYEGRQKNYRHPQRPIGR